MTGPVIGTLAATLVDIGIAPPHLLPKAVGDPLPCETELLFRLDNGDYMLHPFAYPTLRFSSRVLAFPKLELLQRFASKYKLIHHWVSTVDPAAALSDRSR